MKKIIIFISFTVIFSWFLSGSYLSIIYNKNNYEISNVRMDGFEEVRQFRNMKPGDRLFVYKRMDEDGGWRIEYNNNKSKSISHDMGYFIALFPNICIYELENDKISSDCLL